MKKEHLISIGIAVVLLIVLGVAFTWDSDQEDDVDNGDQANQIDETDDDPRSASSGATVNRQNTQAAATPQNNELAKAQRYAQAVKTYEYRVEFDDCRGAVFPGQGTLTIKKGVNFMIDNRDPVAHTFTFRTQTVTVAAYDFVIVTAKDLGDYNITCDGGGAAKLDVQP